MIDANLLLALPLLIPLSCATALLLAWRYIAWQRWVTVVGMALLLAAGVALLSAVADGDRVLVSQVGGWPAPFGISLVADLFSAIMVCLAGAMGLAVAIYSLGNIDRGRESFGYYPLLNFLLLGVCGAFLTGDLFNLYVWFEVMLMSSFVLLALGGERYQLQGGITYVTLNLVASAIFLAAVGTVYAVAGTLNMADLARHIQAGTIPAGLTTTLAMLFLIAFGIKAAVFPLFYWLPASYHTPPVAVSAIFAGLLTKVGVYALIRVFTLIFMQEPHYTHGLILVVSGVTMVTGVLGAAAQHEMRRILSFHIISQIGYMTMGLGLYGLAATSEMAVLALAGSVFYIMHHIIVKTNLFLISGVVERLCGSTDLARTGGMYQRAGGLAVLFLIAALSLAGVPPLSGFFAKLTLIQAGFQMGQYAIVATALVVGLLTLFSMMKIWAAVFWQAPPEGMESRAAPRGKRFAMLAPIAALAACTVAIGLAVEPAFDLAQRAARQLHDPAAYVRAVLGDAP